MTQATGKDCAIVSNCWLGVLCVLCLATVLSAAPPDASAPPDAPAIERAHVFDPLLADPRWPRFSVSYLVYDGDGEELFDHVGATNFGYPFSFLRFEGAGGEWDIGLHAGVFAIFDMDADSTDLINADYFVAAAASYRRGDFSLLGRILHLSGHLGDEFILRNPDIERINLAYEGISLLASYDLNPSVRLYGGGEYWIGRDPGSLDPWTIQYGVELRSPRAFLGDSLRPVAAADVKHVQETDWDANVSLRAGVQLEGGRLPNNMQLLVEYYNGHSPNGQLFNREIEYIGIGLHVFF